MPPSILKGLFVLLFLFSFVLVTQPKAIWRMPSSLFGKVTKKNDSVDPNDIKLF
ncbi:hypothetical protein OAQ99_00135 [Candidatus Kapabacteria bacterium]|nr:hypothetical protein [Candidatus Kapabacteria bacterium]